MITDYFGARQEASRQRNSDYIGVINERNRERQHAVIAKKSIEYVPRWNKEDRRSALSMYQHGHSTAEIASALGRTSKDVFDELQMLIACNILGAKKIDQYTLLFRAVPEVDMVALMSEYSLRKKDWQEVLHICGESYYGLRGKRGQKDVAAWVAINMARFVKQPVDKLFRLYTREE